MREGRKEGRRRSAATARRVQRGVLRHSRQEPPIEGIRRGFAFDGFSGVVIDSPSLAAMSEPAITMDGAIYVGENSRMRKTADLAGHAFDIALSAAVQAAASRI